MNVRIYLSYDTKTALKSHFWGGGGVGGKVQEFDILCICDLRLFASLWLCSCLTSHQQLRSYGDGAMA